MQTFRSAVVPLLFVLSCACCASASAKAKTKVHIVTLGPARHVAYTPPDANPNNKADETTDLRVRALVVDGVQREWTVGEVHDVTDRTFVVRRMMHINDSLPAESVHWTWQPGPWLMVDRSTGHITALHLPDFDPEVSNAVWFRDDAAYCGITATAKPHLVAVVAELGARRAVVQKTLSPWPQANAAYPVCATSTWQRNPMRATLQQTGGQPMTFDVVGTSSLVEENDNSGQ